VREEELPGGDRKKLRKKRKEDSFENKKKNAKTEEGRKQGLGEKTKKKSNTSAGKGGRECITKGALYTVPPWRETGFRPNTTRKLQDKKRRRL